MKQDLFSDVLVSAETQTIKLCSKVKREDALVFFFLSLKILFENLNPVNNYDKTFLTVFALVTGRKTGGA